MGGELYGTGGWAKYVRELTNYLVSRGYAVKILCRMGKMYTNMNEVSTDFHFRNTLVHHHKRGYSIYILMQLLSVIFGVIRLVKDIRYEGNCQKILHAHDASSSLLTVLLIKKLFKLPLIIQIHGFPLREQYINLAKSKSLISNFVWFLTRMWHNVAVNLIKTSFAPVLVNNSEVKSFYESCGVPSSQIKIISSAVDLRIYEKELLSKVNALTRLGINELNQKVTFGYIGGLRPEKNVEMLIKAFSDFLKYDAGAKAKLLIIGEGSMKRHLEEKVNENNLRGYVLFFGFIADAYQLLNAIDIFVLPSLSEGSPFSLIEAMAAGKAIIASNIPAIREIVEDGKEALLFNPYIPEQLKEAILKLYHNPELRRKLGQNAEKKVKQYDINVVFPKIIEVYRARLERYSLPKPSPKSTTAVV